MTDTLRFFRHAHDRCIEFSHQFVFNKRHPLHLQAVSLYGSILEITSDCLLLTEDGPKSGVPILLRAILEAHVDLHNLCEDPKYGCYLEYSFADQWLKLLKEAKSGQNPYLMSISTASDIDERIREYEEQKIKLEKGGYSRLTIETKFRRAGMEHEYGAVYRKLCSFSHHNIQALRERHLELKDGGDFDVVFYKNRSIEDIEIYLGSCCELLVRATEKIHELLESQATDGVRELRKKLESLRSEVESQHMDSQS